MREIGKTGIKMSEIGLGCWPIGGLFYMGDTPDGYGDVSDDESVRAVRTALDGGINLFDTADVYGTGHSEAVLGQALAGQRGQAVIATKFGYGFNEATKTLIGEIYSPGYIERALEASLQRLGTDYIDIYQLHVGSLPADRHSEVFGTCEALVKKGKIRAFGWSSDDQAAAGVIGDYPDGVSVEYECNVIRNNPEMIEAGRENGLIGFCRSPLGMGLLTGKYRAGGRNGFAPWDVRSQSYEWCGYFKDGKADEAMLEKLAAVREILCAGGRSLVEGALGWLMARSENHVPIPGFRNSEQVLDHCRAREKGPLTGEQMKEVENVLGK